MDKYEYKLKAEEIRTLAANKQYIEAMKIADTIDWTRVKSVMMLNVVSEIYKMNRRYEDSKEILLLAYERHPGGRSILYSLCELSIKMEEFVQAVEYYKEFVQEAPKDMGRYILQYKLYEAQEVSLEERISVLEEFKKRDYREKWAYELAFLYHRIGLATRCVEECDELILWFGEGKYVTKAMELKMLHEPLTPAQMEKYQSKKKKTIPVTEEYADSEDEMDIQIKPIDMGQYNTINLQQELAASMQELMEAHEEYQTESYETEGDFVAEAIVAPLLQETSDISSVMDHIPQPIQRNAEEVYFSEEDYIPEEYSSEEYTTEEYVSEEYVPEEYTTEEYATEGYTTEEYLPEEDYPEEGALPQEQYETEATYPSEELYEEEYVPEEYSQETLEMQGEYEQDPSIQEIYFESNEGDPLLKGKEPVFATMLSQEYDGQISLVVPESEQLEKQITGQMSIEDILLEWERMKKANEEKRAEDVRQRVLSQTSDLFFEFDAATKADLLKDLNELADSLEDRGDLVLEDEEELSESEELAEAIAEEYNEEELSEEPVEEYYEEEEELLEEPAEEYYEEEEELLEEPAEEYYEEEEALLEEPAEEYYEEEEALLEEPIEEYYAEAELLEETTEQIEEYHDEKQLPLEEAEEAALLEQQSKERGFSAEQEKLFSTFISSDKNKQQIVEALDKISLAPYTGNIIITGDMGTGTLTLAKNLIKEVQLTDNNFSGKVAKISGDALNRRNIADTVGRLKNGALLIEKSGGMSTKALEDLEKALEKEDSGIIVVMEDSKKEMEKLLGRHRQIEGKFNARIDIAELSNDALVAHAKEYALKEEYSIDQLGVLALYTRIAELQTSEHAVNIREVEEIIDEAIHHVNRKNPSHFKDILFGKRYDEEDMIILRENDFINY